MGGLIQVCFHQEDIELQVFQTKQKIREAECDLECQERQLEKGKTWPGGRNRKNSDRLGEKGKGFRANSSVLKRLIRGSEPELSN